ncbi:hypothetical protein GIB67_030524 [Kingdonia uniflora]|uniref:glutamate synthase (ferredoxin) n=1 Tax=Kingdonia uniflora TaxID=39325 RepID=A0A7J7LCU4_9MAGN|nr:hypothetical protein GIB67_030524 [Kingdonia uniflora]
MNITSKVGVLPMDESKVTMKGRLGPGMMISVDLQNGQVYENTDVKKRVALLNPYAKWLNENMRSLKPANFLSATIMDGDAILRHQQAYGYSSEDVQMVIESMASQGKEPTFCMGDDIPLAVLSQKPHMLYDYFKQRFAQVGVELADSVTSSRGRGVLLGTFIGDARRLRFSPTRVESIGRGRRLSTRVNIEKEFDEEGAPFISNSFEGLDVQDVCSEDKFADSEEREVMTVAMWGDLLQ